MKQDVQPKPLLLVILLCSFYSHPQQPSTYALAQKITRPHCANRDKWQHELFTQLKKEKHLDREHYDIILDALELNTNIPFLKEHHATIESACCTLHALSGFFPTLLRLLKSLECSDYAKGPFYELETALHIQQHASATGERVLALNEHHANEGGFDREFDVVTNRRWIECKDCN